MRRAGALAILATAALLPTAAIAATGDLTLSPSSGPPSQPFTATFSFAPGLAPCRSYTVQFTWDGHALGAAPAQGKRTCAASLAARPPAVASTPGQHRVDAATSPSGFAASAVFTITGPAPSPSPTPSPTTNPSPTPAPTPSAAATPGAAESPGPSASLGACTADAVPAAPAATATFAGNLELPGIAVAIPVISAGPPQMLPPLLGSQRLIAMDLTKAEDDISPLLQNALTENTVYPCVYLSLGQGSGWTFVRFAFRRATVIGLQSSLNGSFQVQETLTLAYQTVDWSWEGDDLHGRLVSRSGGGAYGSTGKPAAVAAPGGAPGWIWLLVGAAALGGLVFGLWRRRSYVGR